MARYLSQSSSTVDGSKSGLLTIARIAPVLTSETTIAPLNIPSESLAIFCRLVSRVVYTLLPGFLTPFRSFSAFSVREMLELIR